MFIFSSPIPLDIGFINQGFSLIPVKSYDNYKMVGSFVESLSAELNHLMIDCVSVHQADIQRLFYGNLTHRSLHLFNSLNQTDRHLIIEIFSTVINDYIPDHIIAKYQHLSLQSINYLIAEINYLESIVIQNGGNRIIDEFIHRLGF